MECFPFPLSSRDRFFLLSSFSICIMSAHAYIFVFIVRIYVAMRDGTHRRAPVGAIVAAQITMPDRQRGQTF